MNQIKTVGIIGLGNFGKFLAALLADNSNAQIFGFDPLNSIPASGIIMSDMRTVSRCDVVILAVPLSAYENVLSDLRESISPETLLVDVCSVKVLPEKLINEILPDHSNLLLTHPLFGPLTKGRRIVVTECRGALAMKVLLFCERSLDMCAITMTSKEHDEEMAQIHVLSLFIARGLSTLQLKPTHIATPTYNMLLDLVKIDQSHSVELFETVQAGNPFGDEMRHKVVETFAALEDDLSLAVKTRG